MITSNETTTRFTRITNLLNKRESRSNEFIENANNLLNHNNLLLNNSTQQQLKEELNQQRKEFAEFTQTMQKNQAEALLNHSENIEKIEKKFENLEKQVEEQNRVTNEILTEFVKENNELKKGWKEAMETTMELITNQHNEHIETINLLLNQSSTGWIWGALGTTIFLGTTLYFFRRVQGLEESLNVLSNSQPNVLQQPIVVSSLRVGDERFLSSALGVTGGISVALIATTLLNLFKK